MSTISSNDILLFNKYSTCRGIIADILKDPHNKDKVKILQEEYVKSSKAEEEEQKKQNNKESKVNAIFKFLHDNGLDIDGTFCAICHGDTSTDGEYVHEYGLSVCSDLCWNSLSSLIKDKKGPIPLQARKIMTAIDEE